MLSSTLDMTNLMPLTSRCLNCRRSKNGCLCNFIKPFHTQTHFLILMHPKEAKKERVGTGRLSHLCLPNSKIIVDASFDQNEEVQFLLASPLHQVFILYPGKDSHNLDLGPHPLFESESKNLQKVIIVIDGTWSCAKSMMRESKTLHCIPRISFDNLKTSRFFIKHQPSALCLSTIESIYQVLRCLNNLGMEKLNSEHENLVDVLDEMCRFQHECSLKPQLGRYRPLKFKDKSEIPQSKKWLTRKIYFEV